MPAAIAASIVGMEAVLAGTAAAVAIQLAASVLISLAISAVVPAIGPRGPA